MRVKTVAKKTLAMALSLGLLLGVMPAQKANAETNVSVDLYDIDNDGNYTKIDGTASFVIDNNNPFESYTASTDEQDKVTLSAITSDSTFSDWPMNNLETGYDPFALDVHLNSFTAANWNEDDLIDVTITLTVPSGYDPSSLKKLYVGAKPPYGYEDNNVVAATSSTDTTATFPAKLMVYAYENTRSLHAEIVLELKKKTGADEGASEKATDGNTYKVTSNTDNTVTLTEASSASGTVTVPDTVDINGKTYKVTEIADNLYKGNKNITKVVIGSNVTKIGSNTFNGCTKLASVDLKNTVEIGDGAFSKCTKLKTVKVPSTTKSIGKNAFSGDKKLKKITISAKSLTSVGKNAFKGIKSNATIKITGSKKEKKAAKKLVTKKKTGYKSSMKIK